jgi:hypothetical protein
VVVGGAMKDPAIVERFVTLAGGPEVPIVVSGDSFEVIGQGYVAIYDNQRLVDSGGRFYFLAPGDRYDMKARQARRRTLSDEPFSRIEEKKWDYSKRDKR